ncbi:hypothetical protein WJX73_006517 [Symbiochloris irregularis]|uniref:Meiotic recombination protein DMC1 n=1 Tax=Symbiochloris irregularis TaxID=706552 RepID=A0AAW1P6T5_9CHLO
MAAQQTREQQQQEEVEEELDEFVPIDKLQSLGINAGDIKKAKEGGFHTCQSMLMNPKKRLAEIKGLSEAKIEKLVEAARKMCPELGWSTAKQVDEQRSKDIVKLSLGADALNELLGGGIETKAITEMYGEYRQALCSAADRKDTDLPHTVRDISDASGDGRRAYTHEQQSELLVALAAMMSQEHFKLLIVDSIMALFRVDFSGRGELSERQQKLGLLMSRLKKIADEFNVAVVITNQVMSDPSGGAMFVADPKKAVGGHVLAHASTVRLSLRKGKAEQRLMKVVDAPNLPEAEASFQLQLDGVADYKG